MRDLVRARLSQGTPSADVAAPDAGLPARFRGRPAMPPAADGRRLPVLDLGGCLFSPEEAHELAERGFAFSTEHRMASATRSGLHLPDGTAGTVEPLGNAMRRLFGRSLRLRSVSAGSCGGCEAELVALGNVVFDMARFGIQFVASPRHADGIVITGAVSRNMAEALRSTYDAVAHPKIVIAVGACAASGGPFEGSPEVLGGVPPEIPVDLWIPGCPPHPMTVLDGILQLLGRLGGRAAGG